MSTVTIPKKEYRKLVEVKFRYERLREAMEDDLFAPPPARSRGEIIKIFENGKKYSRKFTESLKKALERSSYFGS